MSGSGVGTCPSCEKRVQLRKNGTMFKHLAGKDYCAGSVFSFPKYVAPVEPYYCETCFWGDCQDCVDEECQCRHWCPTQKQLKDVLKICPFCHMNQRVGKDGNFDYHGGIGSNYLSCKGSNTWAG